MTLPLSMAPGRAAVRLGLASSALAAMLAGLGAASAAWASPPGGPPNAVVAPAALAPAALAPAALAPAADDADDQVTWGVQPSTPDGPDGRGVFDYQVAPGTVITDWIAVTNRSERPADFRVYAADATTDHNTAQFTLIGAEQASTDLGAWTAVDSGPAECPDSDDQAEQDCARGIGVRVVLAAGEQRNLPIVITVPADATPGDHAAGVVASFEQASQDQTGTLMLMEQRVGARIYLRVDGPLSAAVGVSGVTAGYSGSWNPLAPGSATVGFDVVNNGNVRLSGAPVVELTGPFGIHLGTATLEPVANLLPGGSGHVTASLPDVAPVFLLSARVTVTPQPGSGDVGASEIDLAPVTAQAVAWAVPWSALGTAALLAGGLWLVIWRRRRSRRILAAELAAYTERILEGVR